MSEAYTLWNTLISQQFSLFLSLLCITLLQTWNLSCFCQLPHFHRIYRGGTSLWWYTRAPSPSRCVWKSSGKPGAFLLALCLPEYLVLWVWHLSDGNSLWWGSEHSVLASEAFFVLRSNRVPSARGPWPKLLLFWKKTDKLLPEAWKNALNRWVLKYNKTWKEKNNFPEESRSLILDNLRFCFPYPWSLWVGSEHADSYKWEWLRGAGVCMYTLSRKMNSMKCCLHLCT